MTQTNVISFADQPASETSEKDLDAMRAELLDALRALGARSIEIYYDGYDDNGSVEFVEIKPSGIELPDPVRRQVDAFGFDFAYDLHPGFEIDGGASGELTWDLTSDSIDVRHNECYREYNTVTYEGL